MVIDAARNGRPAVVRDAIYMPDLPSGSKFVHFHWGKVTPLRNRVGEGNGLAKVIGKHGIETVDGMIETLARGRIVEGANKSTVVYQHIHKGGTYRVILRSLEPKKNKDPVWVISSYRRGKESVKPFDSRELTGPMFFDK